MYGNTIGILVLTLVGVGIGKILGLVHIRFLLTAHAGELVIILVEHILELVAVAEDSGRAFSVQLVNHLITGGLAGHGQLMLLLVLCVQ